MAFSKLRHVFCFSLLLLFAVLIAACGDDSLSDDTSTSGRLTVGLVDAPADEAASVEVAISGLRVHGPAGTDTTYRFCETVSEEVTNENNEDVREESDTPMVEETRCLNPDYRTIDLLKLTDGNVLSLLKDVNLPAGRYEWMQLLLADDQAVYVTMNDGSEQSIIAEVDSGQQTGLTLVGGFDILPDQDNNFIIDFDVRKSLHTADDGGLTMRPTLRLIRLENSTTQQLSGFWEGVPEECTSPMAYVYIGDVGNRGELSSEYPPHVTTDFASSDDGTGSSYQIHFIEPGTYTVDYVCNGEIDTLEKPDDGLDVRDTRIVTAGSNVTDIDEPTPTPTALNPFVTSAPPNQTPTASFSAAPLSGVAPLQVTLNASASSDPDGDILGYAWNFGNGSGTGQTVSREYPNSGTYTIRLTVTDDDGATATTTRQVVVSAPAPQNQTPTASFSASPLSGVAPLQVSLNASTSSDPDGTIVGYAWKFGNGSTGTGQTTSRKYFKPGRYTITLTVTDNDGATATTTRQVVVSAPAPQNQKPTASFSASPLSGVAPLQVSLNASASSDSDGTIASYAWNFGNGSTGTGQTASRKYFNSGSYTITLTVTDNDGATATTTRQVVVSAPPTSGGNDPELVVFDWNGPVMIDDRGFPWDWPPMPSANGDWTKPINYAEGTLEMRVRIRSQPVAQQMRLQFCIWQDNNYRESCTKMRDITGTPGASVTWSEEIPKMWKKAGRPILWSQERMRYGVAVKDENGDPISDHAGWEWFGENPNQWYPLNMRYQVVVVPKGQTFSGWQNY